MSYQIPGYIRDALMAEFAPLSEIVDNAVNVSFRTANIECRGREGEVDKVLQFFIEGLELIETEFNRHLAPRRIEVSISGIFAHQTPLIELVSPPVERRCELADLCILATYGQRLSRGDGLGNAIFLQAKNNFDHDASPVQRALYESEREYRYYRPRALSSLTPSTRNLPEKGEPALAYWELEQDLWWSSSPWNRVTSMLWANQARRHHPVRTGFGAAMIDFLRGAGGFGFRAPKAGEKAWSQIIFDLLNVTARAAVKRDNLNVRGAPRGMGTISREILRAMRGSQQPFVLRNSLAKTLALYSEELGKLGFELEAARKFPFEEKLKGRNGDGDDGRGGEPPILGNDREFDGEENGGGGNLIFINFSRRKSD
jgi:hypothetical protein